MIVNIDHYHVFETDLLSLKKRLVIEFHLFQRPPTCSSGYFCMSNEDCQSLFTCLLDMSELQACLSKSCPSRVFQTYMIL